MSEQNRFRVALVGNPNCGKSTLFNRLTGSRQRVGNYSGVTVERVSGIRRVGCQTIEFVDLPGAYSLESESEDERIVRKTLENESFDLILSIVDESNLHRNLSLTLEVARLGLPMLIVFNMSDVAKRYGWQIDTEGLATRLGFSAIETNGRDRHSVDRLLRAVVHSLEEVGPPKGRKIDDEFVSLSREEAAIRRNQMVDELCADLVHQIKDSKKSATARLDAVLTHRRYGILIFLGIMYLVFWLTFTLGQYPADGLETLFGSVADWVNRFYADSPQSVFRSFLVDALLGGVGGVLVFLPNIVFLFLAISLLEDSGYMARAALMMNRFLRKIGLPGNSFIPLLLGFGCSVPAIMAARTLEDRRDRLTTIFIVPLMSCGARLPIYTLLIPAFFLKKWQAPILWLVYLTGILLALVLAKLLRGTFLRGGNNAMIIELPPYHLPTARTVGTATLFRAWLYLKKAGTLIFAISVILWAMSTFPHLSPEESASFDRERKSILLTDSGLGTPKDEPFRKSLAEIDRRERERKLERSFIGRVGHGLEPILRPAGFDWKIGTALLGAFAAKEVFVAQLGIIFRVEEGDENTNALREILARRYSPLVGMAVILFCLIGMPCMATFAVVARETGGWRFAFAQWGVLTVLAWLVATTVYQFGTLLGFGGP